MLHEMMYRNCLPVLSSTPCYPSFSSVADPHHLDADENRDPVIHFDANPDPTSRSDADSDPTFHSDADPDPTFKFDAGPDFTTFFKF
jgi:hypothetical protein